MSNIATRISMLLTAGAACLAATAGTAHAAGPHNLSFFGPSTVTAGQPVVLQATGINPADESHLTLDVHVIPTSVLTTCPDDFLSSLSISSRVPGGDWVATSQPTGAGSWSRALAFTPSAPGGFIVCGYTHDISYTLATASMPLTVRPASDPAPAPTLPTLAPGATSVPQPPEPGPGTGDGATPVALTQASRSTKTYTRFSKLAVRGVPSGSKVVATCRYRGKRCPGKVGRTFTRRNASGTVSLSSFTRTRFKPGTAITVTVTGTDGSRTKQVITTRRGKAPRIS